MPRSKRPDSTIRYFSPRLTKQLEGIKSRPFTLLEAPSGYGKTTLLEEFFHSGVTPAFPVFAYDFEWDVPSNAWSLLCEKLCAIDPVCSRRLLLAGPPEEENLTEIGMALRDLDCSCGLFLWLDNYSAWKSPCAGPLLDLLSRCGTETFHVVVSTQPLAPALREPLLLSGRIGYLGPEALALTVSETEDYFRIAGRPLLPEQARRVHDLTGGQIMALCLQLICLLTRGDFDGGGIDSLMEISFWEQLTPIEQQFLLDLSIFPVFTLNQAAALSGLSPEQIDHTLREKRRFIRFDPDSRCFYPHTYLRRLLRRHFDLLPREQQQAIYIRGGELAQQAHDRLNTLKFYYASGQWERLLELPLTSYDIADVTDPGTADMIVDILEHTPLGVKRRHPAAVVPMAFALFFLGQHEKLAGLQGEIRQIIIQSDLELPMKNALLGELELLVSFLEYNRIEDMSIHHRRALELLGGPARLINLKSTWTFGSPSVLYLYWRTSGELDRELEQMDRCMPVYYELTRGHGFGAELMMRAEALFLRGESDKALPLCYRALFAADSRRQTSIYLCGLFLLGRIAIQTGDAALLESARQSLRDRARADRGSLGRYTADLVEGYVALLLGRIEEVPEWLFRGEIDDSRLVPMVQPFAFIVSGRCMLYRREFGNLTAACDRFLALSARSPNLLPQVYAHIFLALSLDATGRRERAVEQLRTALAIALPDRVYMPFVENFLFLRTILNTMPDFRSETALLSRLYRQYENAWGGITHRFTPREWDILGLVKRGMTNKMIAEELQLSPNTVRNILSGMMKKKGLSSRRQLAELNADG